MTLYVPFAGNMWFEVGASRAALYTLEFCVTSILVVVVSKVLMYQRKDVTYFSVFEYIVWNFAELVAVSLVYAGFTTLGAQKGYFEVSDTNFVIIFLNALVFCLGSLGAPYVIAALYLELAEKNDTIRLMNYSNVVSDAPEKPYDEKRITLFDNNGVLKFSIDSDNLYYIESDDNYIKVWYSDSTGEIKQYMLRCRLKTVEESFSDSQLVRCHRKYIVNISKVKILRSEKDGYKVSLGLGEDCMIPISKTYEQNVLARFNSQ